MKILIAFILAFSSLCFLSNFSIAVPIPEERHDIEGTIDDISWYPSKSIKGIKGMSGSAGKDRTMPSHYIIKLTSYKGINHDTARRISQYINWNYRKNQEETESPFILLKINSNDPYYLQKGLKIRVIGYTIRGDEGGTYTYYEKIEIISSDTNQ